MNELKDKGNEINKLNLKIFELNAKIEEKDNLLNKYLIDMKEEQNKILVSEEKIKDLSNVINQLQKELNSSINTNTNSNILIQLNKKKEKKQLKMTDSIEDLDAYIQALIKSVI